MPLESISSWPEAAATAQRADWSRRWWQAEETAAKVLHESASSLLGEVSLLGSLSAVTLAAAALQGPATHALSRAGVEDPALGRVAAGAAALPATRWDSRLRPMPPRIIPSPSNIACSPAAVGCWA